MRIKNITHIGKQKVYDITVADDNSYTLHNGVKSHNTGGVYSSDTILIVGKRQVKDGKDLLGHEFVLKAEKSRFIKERSAIPVTVLFDGGLYKYSSMFEWAVELGYIEVPSQGWYVRKDVADDKRWRKKQIEDDAESFFAPIMNNPQFIKDVESLYSLDSKVEMNEENIDNLDKKLDALLDD